MRKTEKSLERQEGIDKGPRVKKEGRRNPGLRYRCRQMEGGSGEAVTESVSHYKARVMVPRTHKEMDEAA